MAEEDIMITSINNYELSIPAGTKNEIKQHTTNRSEIWSEIKNIRKADPTGGIIPFGNRICSYGSLDILLEELLSYHSFMTQAFEQAQNIENHNQMQLDNDIQHGNEENDDIDMDDRQIEPIAIPRVPLNLLFQISSPDQGITGDIIYSWFRNGNSNSTPNNLISDLQTFLQQWFDKFNSNNSLSIECRAYNEIVRKHVPAKYNADNEDRTNWLGNQHKVMVKKSKSISKSLGSIHMAISFDAETFLRNDAPNNCQFRVGYAGAPVEHQTNQDMIAAKAEFEEHIGIFLGKCITIVKSLKKTRLENIGIAMAELESKRNEYITNDTELEYYKEMDELRKERTLLLESADIEFQEEDNEHEEYNDNDE